MQVVFAGFACSIAGVAGCAFLPPADPIPGYDTHYRVLDADNAPVPWGLLLMRTNYNFVPSRFRVFDVRDGVSQVPQEVGLRFCYGSTFGLPIYWGTLVNPQSTYVFPLSPRHVAAEDYSRVNRGRLSTPGSRTLANGIIRVRPADPAEELRMLRMVAADMAEKPERQDVEDFKARQRVLRYVELRFKKLGIAEKVPGLSTPTVPDE
jgi:hypothetical protein